MFGDRSRYDFQRIVRTATFVVAANDSLSSSKAQADYVCDGVDDDAEIQAALDALPDAGGEVFCCAGSYSIPDTVEIPSNTTLRFENGNSITVPGTAPSSWTFKKASPLTKNSDNVYCMFTNDDHSSGNTRVKVIGAQIDFGSGTGETAKYDGYYGAAGDAGYSVWTAIWFDNCTESVIEDCYAEDVLKEGEDDKGRQFGLLFSDCSDCVMKHCKVTGAGYEGIGIRDDNIRILIDDCWGTGNDSHVAQAAAWSPAGGGTYPGSPEDIVFRNIRGSTTSDDICIHGISDDPTKGVIIENCAIACIRAIGNLHNVSIVDNTAQNIQVGGVGANDTVKGINVSGNVIDANSWTSNYAIQIQTGAQDGGHVKNVLVEDNIITDGVILIQTGTSTDATVTSDITDVEISGNMFVLHSQTELDLIQFLTYGTNDLTDVTLKDNFLSYTSGTDNAGVLFNIQSDADITHIEIIGNRFHCYYGVEIARAGGKTGKVTDLRFLQNQVYATNVALRFISTDYLDGAIVARNDFEYLNYGLYGGTNVLIQDNKITAPVTSFEIYSPTNVTYVNNNAQPPIALTSGTRSIRHYENGLTFTNTGAGGSVQFDLPAARVGMEFRFIVGATQQLQIDPDDTETIAISNTQQAAGKYVWADAVGETVLLRCITAGEWEDWQSLGTWTAEA